MRWGGNRRAVADDPGAPGVTKKEVTEGGLPGRKWVLGGRAMGEGRRLLKSNRPQPPETDRSGNAAIRTSRPLVSVSPVEQLGANAKRQQLASRCAESCLLLMRRSLRPSRNKRFWPRPLSHPFPPLAFRESAVISGNKTPPPTPSDGPPQNLKPPPLRRFWPLFPPPAAPELRRGFSGNKAAALARHPDSGETELRRVCG